MEPLVAVVQIYQCTHPSRRYVPQGLIFSPGKYATTAVGYTSTFSDLRTWVLTRLAWMDTQLTSVLKASTAQQPSLHRRYHEHLPNIRFHKWQQP